MNSPLPPSTRQRARSQKITVSQSTSKDYPNKNWVVRYPNPNGGNRLTKRFETERKAKEFAKEREDQIFKSGIQIASLDERILHEAVWCKEQLKGAGASLRDVVTEWRAIQEKLRPYSADLVSVVSEWIQLHEANQRSKEITKVVEEMLALKNRRKKSEKYLKDLNLKLQRFASGFEGVKVSEISTQMINDWLSGLDLKPITVNGYLRNIHVLFEYALKSGYVDSNPAKNVEKAVEIVDRVEIFTPEEIKVILSTSPLELLPSLAIGAFAGLRTSEIAQLNWDLIDFEKCRIDVTGEISKTNRDRYVPIPPNLLEWLSVFKAESGSVAAQEWKLEKFRKALRAKNGIKWKSNGLRHSFASYALAKENDAPKVAMWLGNSPKVLFKHYRERVTTEEADAYFSILPEETELTLDS